MELGVLHVNQEIFKFIKEKRKIWDFSLVFPCYSTLTSWKKPLICVHSQNLYVILQCLVSKKQQTEPNYTIKLTPQHNRFTGDNASRFSFILSYMIIIIIVALLETHSLSSCV